MIVGGAVQLIEHGERRRPTFGNERRVRARSSDGAWCSTVTTLCMGEVNPELASVDLLRTIPAAASRRASSLPRSTYRRVRLGRSLRAPTRSDSPGTPSLIDRSELVSQSPPSGASSAIQAHPTLGHEPLLLVANPRFPHLRRAPARHRSGQSAQLARSDGANERGVVLQADDALPARQRHERGADRRQRLDDPACTPPCTIPYA